jgi:outer membrane protein OmpA-like peptidoglycan-associated protein
MTGTAMKDRKFLSVLLASGFCLSACSTTAQQQTRTPVADVLPSGKENNRILDGRIRRDLDFIETLQGRIKALNDKGIPVEDYNLARAQCWLSFGLEEYHENDRTGIIETALTESANIVSALEQSRQPEATKHPVATSVMLREDLWARLKALQASPWRSCAAEQTGCLEVILSEAGHEYRETGWRHARGTIAEAERMTADAETRVAKCAEPPPAPPAPAPVVVSDDDDRDGVPNKDDRCPNTPPPARVDATGCEFTDEIKLPGVLFDSDQATLKTDSFAVLDGAVATLKRYPDLRIEVAGHTDDRASDAHNLDLSQRRAETVRRYLAERSVSNTLSAKGYGETTPIASNKTVDGRAANRRVVLRILKN